MTLIVYEHFLLYLLNLTMEQEIILPSKPGQICRIVHPLSDEDPEDVYIVSEDPALFDNYDTIYVTNLKDLQRNIAKPLFAPQIAIIKGELTVVAEHLESYINSWNNK